MDRQLSTNVTKLHFNYRKLLLDATGPKWTSNRYTFEL